MQREEQEIQKSIEIVGQKMKGETSDHLKKVVDKVIKKGVNMGDVLGLNEQVIGGIYGQAYRLYNSGRYKDACQLFRLLVALNSTDAKHIMGLAASFHMMKEYMAAAELYSLCGLLDPNNPIPGYHASDCYIAIGDKASAIIALEGAVNRSKEKSEYSQLKDRALMTISSLQKELLSEK